MTDTDSPPFKRRPRSRLATSSLQPQDPIHLAPPTSDANPASYRTELHNLFDTPLTTHSLGLDMTPPGADSLPSDEERRCESYYRLGLLSDPKDPKSDTGVKLVNLCGMLYCVKVVDRRDMDTEEHTSELQSHQLSRMPSSA